MSKYSDAIEEALTGFNDKNFDVVTEKAIENNTSDAGEIPVAESILNLKQCVSAIQRLIKKNTLSQLPLGIQKSLSKLVQEVSGYINNILGGTPQHDHLVDAIDKLYSWLWTQKLLDLSESEADYLEKLNYIKGIESQVMKILERVRPSIKLSEQITKRLEESNKIKTEIENSLEQSKTSRAMIENVLGEANSKSQQIGVVEKTIEESRAKVLENLTSTAKSQKEVERLEERVKEFFDSIDEYKTKLESTFSEAKSELAKHNSKADEVIEGQNKEVEGLIKKLQGLESQIEKVIKDATGYSLFHSFQTRKNSLRLSRIFWLFTSLSLAFLAVFIAYNIAVTTIDIGWDIALTLKVLTGIPLAFVIWFCAVQYGRERRLEEEYAFKSNISISLVPYKNLVQELVTDGNREQFFKFLIDSISEVFASPTEKVFQRDRGLFFGRSNMKSVESVVKCINGLKNKTA